MCTSTLTCGMPDDPRGATKIIVDASVVEVPDYAFSRRFNLDEIVFNEFKVKSLILSPYINLLMISMNVV